MTELRLFENVKAAPTAMESALLDWISTETTREYCGSCPIQYYHALLRTAARLCNPQWKDLGDFPPAICALLNAAFNAMFRTMEANSIVAKTTEELRQLLKRMRERRPSVHDPWYEQIVTRAWVEEELRERAILSHNGPLAVAEVR